MLTHYCIICAVFVVNVSVGRVCPSNYNPADFFVQQLAIQPGHDKKCRQFIQVSTSLSFIAFVIMGVARN